MEKLFIDKWFKLPPKEKQQKYVAVKIVPKGRGKQKNGESCKKIKKKTSKKSG